MINLRSVDLNLLVVFEALMAERHVSKAAERVALSQPAMSNALARLRQILDDPVLVRTARGMEPTPRALALQAPIREALRQIEQALASPAAFDPATAHGRFVIGASDYMEFLALPPLLKQIQQEAPGVDVAIRSLQIAPPAEGLEDGELDVAFGFFPNLPKRLRHEYLFTEHLVCTVRADHPTVGDHLTLEQFVALPHLFVATRTGATGEVDRALANHGLHRRIACIVPHFLVAPFIVAESDLILTVNTRIAETFARQLPLKLLKPPVALPEFRISMVWHPRNDKDPAQLWLRRRLAEACGSVES